jgi:nucleoside 2-deoxyribosyltransferase
MKCFVASAFDRKDVDAIYDRAVRPTLKQLKVSPLRVNRVLHNEDVDDKIFELLDAADICIADLTYARPSVYYEARYAFAAGKPVIYIAREDHFQPLADDPEGNLRIHFDLQMKNIIPWKEANRKFADALRGRIRHVMRPLQDRKRISEARLLEQSKFAVLPMSEKIRGIREKARNLLRRRRFADLPYSPPNSGTYYGFQFGRLKLRVAQCVQLAVYDTINSIEFERTRNVARHVSASESCITKATEVHSLVIFATLSPIRSRRLAKLLPHFTCVSDGVYQHSVIGGNSSVPITHTVAAIDSIKSLADFAERYLFLLAQHGFD